MLKEKPDQEGIAPAIDLQSQTNRSGAPDGLRTDRKNKYDRRDPLEDPGHEAIAQFLAFPKHLREFKSLNGLAAHFKVTRMTVHRWTKKIDVMQRAEWLSLRNKMAGKLVLRREWERIARKLVEGALNGDVQAMKLCERLAWTEDNHAAGSGVDHGLSLAEGIRTLDSMYSPPTWLMRQQAAERRAEEESAARIRALLTDPEDPSE